ncbi:integral membrane protein [Fusarium denticulatum]|uniref:Integral membrane protein n=1 Tax=Fusarium denticulatum TaxID=48507 RepID=A0A8H6CWP9_9HYPO|nr:integral membrane protein [Fusarium denticulatum]
MTPPSGYTGWDVSTDLDRDTKGSYEVVVIDRAAYNYLILKHAAVENPRSGGPIRDKLALEACSELRSVGYQVLAWLPYCDEAMPFMDQQGNTLPNAERPSIENWPDLGVTRLREQNLQLKSTVTWREIQQIQHKLSESVSTDMCLKAFSLAEREQELLRQDAKENVDELSSLHKEVKDLEAANNNGNKDPRMAELLEGLLNKMAISAEKRRAKYARQQATVQEREDALANASSHEKEVQNRYDDEYASNSQSRRLVEIATSLRYLDETCERPRRDRRNDAWPYLSIHILCILCAVIRVYTKLFIVRKISPEDWPSFTSLVIYIVYFGIGHHALMSAFGQDIWWVNADDLSHALKLFWIDCPVYTLLLGMTKVTIILFYIRLCHVYTLFCQLCWACILIISISTGVFMSLNIFQCTPIRWNWDRFGGEDVDFWCMDLNKLQWSINITNIIFDIVVLVLPIPLIWKTKSTFRRKLGIVLMFSLGVVVLVASCLKMRYNVLYGHSNNITWDYMDLMVWAGIESSVSIAAPCLPTVRLFLHKVFPSSFGRIFAFGSHVERTLDQEIKEEEEEVAQWAADVEMTGISGVGVARPRRAAISLGEGFKDGRRTKKKRAMTEASRILRSVDEIALSP